MTAVGETPSHARLMDGVYRHQRHIYDLTRKFYLLGRDTMIEGLAVPPEGTVLELGCGTGRNLALTAERYPHAAYYGLDISSAMLATASTRMRREHIDALLAQGDASNFDAAALFGRPRFDRIFLSYALSMIPRWEQTIACALDHLTPGGSLHIVDFGQQEGLPAFFRAGLRRWLSAFHVSPRDSLRGVLESECERRGANLSFDSQFRGYAVRAIVTVR